MNELAQINPHATPQRKQYVLASADDALWDRFLFRLSGVGRFVRILWWSVLLMERTLREAFRSFLGHIKEVRARNHFVGVGFGCHLDPTGRHVPCIRTDARTKDMQWLYSKYPWANLVDLAIFLDGWDRAEKSLSRQGICHYCTEQSVPTNS